MALNSLNSMKNGIEITEFNAKFWAIFEILDFKGSQLSETLPVAVLDTFAVLFPITHWETVKKTVLWKTEVPFS